MNVKVGKMPLDEDFVVQLLNWKFFQVIIFIQPPLNNEHFRILKLLNFLSVLSWHILTVTYIFFQSQLNGFYDPCINEDKYLKIVYEFRDALHEAVFQDDEPVRIPKQCK